MAITVDVQRITRASVSTFDEDSQGGAFSTVKIACDECSNVTLFLHDENHAERARKIAEAINAK